MKLQYKFSVLLFHLDEQLNHTMYPHKTCRNRKLQSTGTEGCSTSF